MEQGRVGRDTPPPAKFYLDKIEKIEPTTGKKTFVDVEMVEVFLDAYSKPTYAVQDKHREKWPKQYAAFKAGREQLADGTSLSMVDFVTPAEIANLQMLGIGTVEELAQVSSSALNFLGGSSLKQKAGNWLKAQSGADNSAALLKQIEESQIREEATREELEEMRAAQVASAKEVEELKNLVATLSAQQQGDESGKQKKGKAASGSDKRSSGGSA